MANDVQIIPFQPDMSADAGELLAARHRAHRIARPELPDRFETPTAAQTAILATLKRPNTSGFAAIRDGRLVAYLIGEINTEPIWGRSGWIRQAGCAAADADLIRPLYATLGDHWVKQGCFAHFALIPSSDAALNQTFYHLSFGVEQVYAIAPLDALKVNAPAEVAGVTIRRAVPGDEDALRSLSDVIWRHQMKAPVWGINLPENVRENAEGWAELAADQTAWTWLAFAGDEPIAAQCFYVAEIGDDVLSIPDKCVHFTVAATREAWRGRGVARMISKLVFAEAQVQGFVFSDTDWRSTNLQSSRTWSSYGFQPTFNRLVRRLDTRIAWANGEHW